MRVTCDVWCRLVVCVCVSRVEVKGSVVYYVGILLATAVEGTQLLLPTSDTEKIK